MKKKLDSNHRFFTFYRTALTKVSLFFIFLPSAIFFIAFLSISAINQGVQRETRLIQLPPPLYPGFKPALYPFLSTPIEHVATALSARGAIVMDNDSKIILFSKNPTISYAMASTTKIMTAVVGLEQYKPDDVLLIKSTGVPAAVVGYQLGEKVAFIDLLYGMLLASGNDAALAIAQNYPGGEQAFIKRMNTKAKELSLFNTRFTDSSGLDNGNYTTVLELAYLASTALQNPIFTKIVGTKEIRTTNADGSKVYFLTNINQLLGLYGVTGVKTGFTPDAGGILVTSAQNNGHTILYVVMKSEDRFADTEKLLSTTIGNIAYLKISP